MSLDMSQSPRDQRWLTASEVQRLVLQLDGRKLSRGMLQHYAREAYVRPRPITVRSGEQGRPSTLGYTLADVVLLRWLMRLAVEGVSLNRFAKGIAALRKLVPEALETPDELRFLVVGRRDIAVQTRDNRPVQLTGGTPGQVLLTFSSVPLVPDTVRSAERIIDLRTRIAGARE